MSSAQYLREFVSQRLAAAAEEIFRVFERTIEEELDRQQRLLGVSWKPQRSLQRSDLLRRYLSKEAELPAEHHPDRTSILNQEEPEPPQIKEEHEELLTAPEENADAFLVQQAHSGLEPNRTRVLIGFFSETESRDHDGSWPEDSESTRRKLDTKENSSRSEGLCETGQTSMKRQMKKPYGIHTDVPHHYISKEEEQLSNRVRSSSLDQEELEPLQIKEEEEEPETLQIKEEQDEQLVLKEEIDAFTVTSAHEESDESQSEPATNLLQNYHEPGNRHQERCWSENVGSTSHAELDVTRNPSYSYTNETQSNMETGQRLSECQFCGKVFESDVEMKEHYKLHTDEKSLSCTVCGKVFKYNVNLLVHMRTHTGEKPYSCEICSKCFSQKVNLNVHMRTHTGEKPYLCKTCGKRFSDSSGFKRHTTIHTGEKPYVCKTCNKTFRYNVNLLVHMRTHTDERPYFCKTCGRTFSDPSTLRKHIITHTGAKSYSCQICGKCFTDNSNLLRHMRTHTGEKPYSCEICSKSFSQSSNLMQHIRTHTGEKPYPCGICDKSYSHSCTLLKHMRSHTGEKPYSCEMCGRCFSHKCTLLKHMKIHTDKVQS